MKKIMKRHISFIESVIFIALILIGFYGCQRLLAVDDPAATIAAVLGFVGLFILFMVVALLNMEKLYET